MSLAIQKRRTERHIWLILMTPLRWLERTKGYRRVALLAFYLLILLLLAAVVWRYLGLRALPDVGDPFDVAAFEHDSSAVPSQADASQLYSQAAGALRPHFGGSAQGAIMWKRGMLYYETPISNARFASAWSTASDDLKSWVDSNRRSLSLFEQAAACPTADLDRQPRHFQIEATLYSLLGLCLLDGARHEDAGEMKAAWVCYRSVLRSIRHLGSSAPLDRRYRLEHGCHPILRTHVERWAADPRVDTALLRQALDDIVAIDSLLDNDLESLRSSYIDLLGNLDHPSPEQSESALHQLTQDLQELTRCGSFVAPRGFCATAAVPLNDLLRFLLNEPERSKRVTRIFYSNWVQNLPALKAGTGGITLLPISNWYRARALLTPAPGVKPTPGGLTGESLAAWHQSTLDAKRLLPDLETYFRALHLRSSNQGTLIMRIAEQAYARDHAGANPPAPEALVGQYLRALPDYYLPLTRSKTVQRKL